MWDDATLEYALEQTMYKARQLIGNHGFGPDDLEDIRQDLLADLVRRGEWFDAGRASGRTFIARLVEHAVADLLERRCARCRDYRRQVGSLDASTEDEEGAGASAAGNVTDTDARAHRQVERPRPASALTDLRLDVEAAIENLPNDLRSLCGHLREESVLEIARRTGRSRGSLYQAIRKLRASSLAEIFEDG